MMLHQIYFLTSIGSLLQYFNPSLLYFQQLLKKIINIDHDFGKFNQHVLYNMKSKALKMS